MASNNLHNQQQQQSQLQPHPHVNNKFFMNPEDAAIKNLSTSNNTSPKKGATVNVKEERFDDENLYKTLNDSLNLSDNSSMNLKLPIDILDNSSNNYILNLSNSNNPKPVWTQPNKQNHILNNVLNSIADNGNDSISAGIGYPFSFNPNNSFDMQQDTHATIHTPPLKTNSNFINHFGNGSHTSKSSNNQNHNFQHLFNQNRTNNNNINHHRKSNNHHHHHNNHHQNQNHNHTNTNTNNPLLSSKSYNVESDEEDDVNWDNLL